MASYGFDGQNQVLFTSIKMESGFGEMGLTILDAPFVAG
jgi:hypothetical protein